MSPAAPFPSASSPRRSAGWLLLAALSGVFGVWLLGSRPPAWYPPCPFHLATGLFCPGCGSGRAVHALVHGEWARALGLNPLLVLLLPFGLAWLGWTVWRGLGRGLPAAGFPRPVAMILLVLVSVYWGLRNLPWWPFVLLAPS